MSSLGTVWASFRGTQTCTGSDLSPGERGLVGAASLLRVGYLKGVTPGAFLSGGPGSLLGWSKTDVVLDVRELTVDAEQANPNLLTWGGGWGVGTHERGTWLGGDFGNT